MIIHFNKNGQTTGFSDKLPRFLEPGLWLLGISLLGFYATVFLAPYITWKIRKPLWKDLILKKHKTFNDWGWLFLVVEINIIWLFLFCWCAFGDGLKRT